MEQLEYQFRHFQEEQSRRDDRLDETLTKIQISIAELTTNVTNLNGVHNTIEGMQTDITDVATRVTTLEVQMKNVQEKCTLQTSKLDGLLSKPGSVAIAIVIFIVATIAGDIISNIIGGFLK